MTDTSDKELSNLISHIVDSRVLGRSPVYAKLLNYFAHQAASGKASSEYSVAIDVFEKPADYDVTSDSTVRVYIYNLRKKLDNYYADIGKHETHRLYIPKGEYRLLIRDSNGATTPETNTSTLAVTENITPVTPQNRLKASLFKTALLTFATVVTTAIITAALLKQPEQETNFSEQQLQFWGGILNDDKPIMIVVGDYFIFAESVDDNNDEIRLIREFDVNSAEDLRRKNLYLQQSDNSLTNQRFDLGLTYLPRGSAYALTKVQQLLQRANKTPRISMMSELSAQDIRANHIIYIGYLSGLGVLEGYTFANSRFEIGSNYDEIIDIDTNTHYRSDFIDAQEDRNFTDFGTISSFSLAAKNQLVTLTGTRDAGLMEMSDIAITENLLDRMQLSATNNQAYEALFEIDGFNLTNISSRLIISGYMHLGD